MKLHEFGLWFFDLFDGEWSTTVPRHLKGGFYIFYDGMCLGLQFDDLSLRVSGDMPYVIRLKNRLVATGGIVGYTLQLDSIITLDDFEIIPNPDYQE